MQRECKHCAEIFSGEQCPKCEAEHERITKPVKRLFANQSYHYGTALGTEGKRVPPKYGWGG